MVLYMFLFIFMSTFSGEHQRLVRAKHTLALTQGGNGRAVACQGADAAVTSPIQSIELAGKICSKYRRKPSSYWH
jgi:hypothetical protein